MSGGRKFLLIVNDVGACCQMGFPECQWCKGHGLPQSEMGHYGLREKDCTLWESIDIPEMAQEKMH